MHSPPTPFSINNIPKKPFAVIVFALFLGTSCVHDDFYAIIQAENSYTYNSDFPVPGSNGVISVSSITDEGVQLSWTKATDRMTQQTELDYRVFRSDSNNISTPDDAEAHGTPLDAWLKDTTTLNPDGLYSNRTYFFNVIVRAPDGRKAAYSTTMAVTLGTIYLYSVGPYDGKRTTNTGSAARTDIDTLCETIPVTGPMNARTLISISDTDVIRDFPTLYAVPTGWPVRSTASSRIAWNWADMLDDSINFTLTGAGISNAAWWSGSSIDGSFDAGANCDGWRQNNATPGMTGTHDAYDGTWISFGNSACSNLRMVLCIAW